MGDRSKHLVLSRSVADVKMSVENYADRYKMDKPTENCKEETLPEEVSDCGDQVDQVSAHDTTWSTLENFKFKNIWFSKCIINQINRIYLINLINLISLMLFPSLIYVYLIYICVYLIYIF